MKITKEVIKEVMRKLGSIKTEKKARASRENGKKGGKPKKKRPVDNPPLQS